MQQTADLSMKTETIIQEQPLAHRMLTGILKRGSVSPAYLFTGTEGLGKLAMAKWFARALFCNQSQTAGEPCETCSVCRQVQAGVHPDLHLIEPQSQGGSISIGQVRDDIRPAVARRTYQGQGKILVVPQAHLLTVQAQNALLKTLEDPQGESSLILISSQPESLLPTVRSRCVRVPFKSLSLEAYARRLEKMGVDDPQRQRDLYETTAADVQLASHLAKEDTAQWELMEKVAERLLRSSLPPPMISEIADRLGSKREEIKRALAYLLVLLRKRLLKEGNWREFASCVNAVSGTIEAIDANANIRLTLEVCLVQLQSSLYRKYN